MHGGKRAAHRLHRTVRVFQRPAISRLSSRSARSGTSCGVRICSRDR